MSNFIYDFSMTFIKIFISMMISKLVLTFVTWGRIPWWPRPYYKTLLRVHLPLMLNSALVGLIFSGINAFKPNYSMLKGGNN